MDQRRIKPWMVGLVLLVAGLVGATLVYQAGARIHASDRRAIVVWRASTTAALAQAKASLAELETLAPKAFSGATRGSALSKELTRIRIDMERARTTLENVREYDVIDVIAAAYLNGVAASLDALANVHQWSFAGDARVQARERESYATHIARAGRLIDNADAAFQDLQDRFELLGPA
jgi:hypothetical protein